MARASEASGLSRRADALTRRELIRLALAAAAAAAWPARTRAAPNAEVSALLESSGFVYVSPLLASGAESRCHGEVWFGWIDGGVVLSTAQETWKARALARGLSRARLWVGDHGRVGRVLGREAFRAAPSFDASARQVKDAAVLDRLMAVFRKKYPNEIGSWEPRMRAGFASGERILIRDEPS
jgi:hypothetical protein